MKSGVDAKPHSTEFGLLRSFTIQVRTCGKEKIPGDMLLHCCVQFLAQEKDSDPARMAISVIEFQVRRHKIRKKMIEF